MISTSSGHWSGGKPSGPSGSAQKPCDCCFASKRSLPAASISTPKEVAAKRGKAVRCRITPGWLYPVCGTHLSRQLRPDINCRRLIFNCGSGLCVYTGRRQVIPRYMRRPKTSGRYGLSGSTWLSLQAAKLKRKNIPRLKAIVRRYIVSTLAT